MSILERLRAGTDSTSSRLTIGVVAAVFVFWGIGNRQGDATRVLATVEGMPISQSDVEATFRRLGNSLPKGDPAVLEAQIVDMLIQKQVLLQEAERLGIRVSSDEVARRFREEPRFQKDGTFDEPTMLRILRMMNQTQSSYEVGLRKDLVLERLLAIVDAGISVPESEARTIWEAQSTQIDLTYVRVSPASFLEGMEITSGEREVWLAANAAKVEDAYKQRFERFYNLPKRFTTSTILLRTDLVGADKDKVALKLEALRAEAAGGADFATLARTWSEDLTAGEGGSLGVQAANQLDPAVLAACEKAGKGGITEVVTTTRGLQILRVESIEDARVLPLEEVRNDIAVSLLKDERAPARMEAFLAEFKAGWTTASAPPAELLADYKLSAESTGLFPMGQEIPRLGDAPGLREALAAAKSGDVLPTIYDVRGTRTLVAVGTRLDADPAEWTKERPMVEGILRQQAQQSYRAAWVQDLVARAKVERPGAAPAEAVTKDAPAAEGKAPSAPTKEDAPAKP